MVSVAMTSVALFYTAITLIIAESYLATDVVNSIRCKKIPCSHTWNCPAWHYCDTHARFCAPCTPCTDGSDFHLRRGNCRDPVPCIESLLARQEYACPKLRIAKGKNCSGDCHPCDGTFGSDLGTTCRVNCSDGDFEVFSCIFLNEVAQWNISRKPFWIDYEAVKRPQPPTTPPSTPSPSTLPSETLSPETLPPETLPLPILSPPSSPLASSTSSTVYHLEALAGIVAGTVLGVSVIVFFAILLIVCSRRRKRRQCQTEGAEEATELIGTPDSTPYLPKRNGPVPVEGDDQPTLVEDPSTTRGPVEIGSSTTISRISFRRNRPLPTEISDHSYYTSNDRCASWVKQSQQRPAVHSISSPSVVSLHSDRPSQPRRPQEHAPPPPPPLPLGFRPAGSSDSGHPRGRCSSSTSLQHETMRKSLTDLGGELRRGPTEQSQETSSGFHPQDSLQDLNTSFPV